MVIKSRNVGDLHEINTSKYIRNTDPKSSVACISSHLKSLRADYFIITERRKSIKQDFWCSEKDDWVFSE